ncbi:MAG: AAA family ATPase [Acidobacteriota bacterium]|jgi:wobble nucleotide-excising tRNase|nr:AAA family ATPase [Acidobacteriota bacterium]
MIRHIRLLRNIGQFDSVDIAASIDLKRLSLVYGENGRGKTTIVSILRSLSTGNPNPILERQRLGSQHPPHIVLECDGGAVDVVFENEAWNRTIPDLLIFDDVFVDESVHSGLVVEAEHRKNLHEVVLGAQGVALSRRIQGLVRRVEDHNRILREKDRAIPEAERQGLSVDEFCSLEERPQIEHEIRETERALAAAKEQEPIRTTPHFEGLSIPPFDLNALEAILTEDLPALDTSAAERVLQHIATLGTGGEQWLSEGMRRLPEPGSTTSEPICPFCAQDLCGSSIIDHYQAYFSATYAGLKQKITDAIKGFERTHSGDVAAGFERAVRVTVERRQFWSSFCEVPEIEIDTAEIVRDWKAACGNVLDVLRRKQAAPMEAMTIDNAVRTAVATHEGHRQRIAALNDSLKRTNESIGVVKEQAAGANPQLIETNLARLRATQSRQKPELSQLCDEYLAERTAKEQTEEERNQVRSELEDYKANVFPTYEVSVNLYLQRFSAGFRLSSMTSTATRGGPACTYSVLINNTPIPVARTAETPGEPSFRNTLSSGDRGTLGLALFLASLDQDPGLANKIVVIDDPISSLDDHRALTTAQQVRRITENAKQVVVLSHDKRFLCRVWTGADRTIRSAIQVVREGNSSSIRAWNVDEDSVTEHDRRHIQFKQFFDQGVGDKREIAKSIRPHIEAYLRVVCPQHFPPGSILGPFVSLCNRHVGGTDEILDASTTRELDELKEYANRFHHDTNPAWETEDVNETELRNFVDRTMKLIKR